MKKLLLIVLLICVTLTTCSCGYTPKNTTVDVGDYDGNDFLSKFADNTPLSQIALPGTHDSGATRDMVLVGTARCQWATISEQLQMGVRYMDIRLKRINGNLDVYHGPASQNLSFDEVLEQVFNFFEQNPSETLIMCIKEEGDPKGDNDDFDKMVQKFVEESHEKWFLENRIPTLGEARGKIVLMRRYHTADTFGFDASHDWTDNDTFTIVNDGYSLAVQDYYQDESVDKKWHAIEDFFQVMKNAQANSYYLNNTSGYISGPFSIPNLNKICKEINPLLVDYLKGAQGIKGIIACDHITAEIAKEIVTLNFK